MIDEDHARSVGSSEPPRQMRRCNDTGDSSTNDDHLVHARTPYFAFPNSYGICEDAFLAATSP
jgi:hypothetical protein